MAERLNSMSYNETPASNYSSPGFNPCSVSLDIRTPEELAAVNEFLLALGRDVSGLPNRPLPSSHSPTFPTENYFDPSNLSQLGLAGMPGIPSSFADASYNGHYSHRGSYHSVRSNHAALPGQYGTMYDLHDPLSGYSQTMDCGRRQSKYTGVSAFSNPHHHRPTPPLDGDSPQSTVSTPPVTTTPPQLSMSMPDTFDLLRPSRAVPVAHLAAPDYMTKTMRPMIPLKSALPVCRPPPVEPILPVGQHRRSPLPSSGSSGTSASGSGLLYPLLTSGDAQYKLPPLGKMYRSPSQQSSSNPSPNSSTRSSPNMQSTVLPSIHSIADYDDEHHLSTQVGSIELERSSGRRPSSRVLPLDRKRHAEFILNLMVTINRNFKNQSQSATDVEMDSP